MTGIGEIDRRAQRGGQLAVGSTLGDELTTGVGLGCEPLGVEQATNKNSRLPVASRSQRQSERGFGMVLLLIQ